MQVNRNCLFVVVSLLALGGFIYGCTSSSSSTSISGNLTVVIPEGGTEQGELAKGSIPAFGPIELPQPHYPVIDALGDLPQGNSSADFIPDEIIVKYQPGMDPASIVNAATSGGYSVLRSDRNIGEGATSILKVPGFERDLYSIDDLKERTLAEIERLNALPYVDFAQPNYIYKPLFVPNDQFYNLQWHYPLIKLDHLWDENLVSDVSGVTVAVIDTGIARSNGTQSGSDHPDFGNIDETDEYDFISNASMALDGNGIDSDATDPGDDPTGQFSSFHGTHVIGTIGALTNNTTGVAGVAGSSTNGTSVKIIPIRVLGSGGSGTSNDIAEAIKYASGKDNTSTKILSPQVDIINMSLGTTATDSLLEDAISDAQSQGVLIIAAAGNNGNSTPFYPAAYSASYDNVISVSAVGIGAEIAPYSSFGSTVNVAAPGGNFSFDLNFDTYVDGILSTFVEQQGIGSYNMDVYAFYQGTSMAAPHVSGVAALMKAANNLLSASDIRNYLESTTIDLDQNGPDNFYGNGLVNAYNAVQKAIKPSNPATKPLLFSFPSQLKLQGENPTTNLTLLNVGDTSTINITNISKKRNAQWLSINPTTGSANHITGQSINVSINTTGFPSITDGTTHTEMLELQWTAGVSSGTEFVYVLYNRNGFPTAEGIDVGVIYAVAIDPIFDIVMDLDITTFIESYQYQLSNLASGSYIIGASTDRDNDGVIFEPQDAFGFYTSVYSQEIIPIQSGQNLTNIDFQVVDRTSRK